MRITIAQGPFLPVPALLGGAVEKVWFSLGKQFAASGHEVTHVSRAYKDLPRTETIEGVHHRRVSGFTSPATFSRRMLCDFWYALRVLPQLPPADILVTNTFWLPVLERRRSRGRIYVHVARYPKGQMKLYRRAILQTVSEPIRQAIIAEEPASVERVRVIAYPLANRYLLPSVGAAEKNILYTGRVHPEKGLHLLISAFAQLPAELKSSWKLKIVGPWEVSSGGGGETYLNELRQAGRGLESQIEFVGPVFDETRLIDYYRNAAVFVYPSLAERGETFGLAALEAMAAGCAPIVSSLACFLDFIRLGTNGLVFDHRTAEPAQALANTLMALLTSPDTIERIRHSAWLTARDFTLPKIANQFLADFESLCHSPK